MAIRITKANVSGFTGIAGGDEPTEPEQAQFFIPAAIELSDAFTIDLIVDGVYTDPTNPEESIFIPASDVRSLFDWDSIGIIASKLNANTFRLVGPASGIFVDQFYKFKMVDLTEKVLPPTTQEPFLGLIQYQMPNPTFILKTFDFEADLLGEAVSLSPPTTEEFTMSQWYSWRFQTAENNIESINARGLK